MNENLPGLDGIDTERIVSSLRAELDVERIYLFGSRARGEQTENSGIDLYVTVAPTDERWARLTGKARCQLLWLRMPKDIMVEATQKFESQANEFASLEYIASRKRVLFYG